MSDDVWLWSLRVAGDYSPESLIACWYLASSSPSNAMCRTADADILSLWIVTLARTTPRSPKTLCGDRGRECRDRSLHSTHSPVPAPRPKILFTACFVHGLPVRVGLPSAFKASHTF
jgi:hypothetical protein